MAAKLKVDQVESVDGSSNITVNNSITMAATKTIPAASLTGTVAANTVDSDSYVDGSIDVAHMSANSVDSAQYVDGSIDTAHIANDQITAALMADNSIDSDMYVDGSIDTAHIADDAVTADKLANAINTSIDAKLPLAGGTITGAVYHGQNNFGNDSGDFMNWTTNTRLDITVHSNNEFRFESDGDFHADGDVIAYSTTTASDRKLKDNITIVEDALDKVKQLNGVEFTWKKDGKKSAGVIAQDVEKVLPQAVKTVNDLNTDEEYKTVKYDALTSILIESIKELSARIEELENK